MRLRVWCLSVLSLSPFSLAASHRPLPLIFEPGAAGGFVGRNAGGSVSMTAGRIEVGLVRMRLAGARPGARPEGLDLLPGKSFYYIGNDPRKWRTGVPQYGRVAYRDIYPGVDLVFYGNGDQLEYDVILGPHADLSRVRLRFDGAQRLALEPDGDLRIESSQGVLRQKKPLVYQEVAGQRRELAGQYLVEGHQVRFAVTGHDRGKGLVIDPGIVYSTYFGGTGDDTPTGMAVDATGNMYVTGYTTSKDFPDVSKTFTGGGGGGRDVFAIKLDPTGQTILYSVLLGGSNDDRAEAITVDSKGYTYLTGYTLSSNFPTYNAYQANLKGLPDAFVTKLDASGNLVYSTYLGGASAQAESSPATAAWTVATDSAGDVYVAGETDTTDFPVTTGPLGRTPQNGDAFTTELGSSGNMVFSTVIGGSGWESAYAIAVGTGAIYVGGDSTSADLPVTSGAIQTHYAGTGSQEDGDVWVAKLTPAGAVAALTYLGGSNDDDLASLCVDASNNVYLGGGTWSSDFPVTAGALQTKYGGEGIQQMGDGWFAKLNGNLTTKLFASYFGGPGDETDSVVELDSVGNLYLVGATDSTTLLPASTISITAALPPGSATAWTGYVIQVKPDGSGILASQAGTVLSSLVYGTSGGGAMDQTGATVYVVAGTTVAGLPLVGTPLQKTIAGGQDIYLAKIALVPPVNPVSITGINVSGGGANIAQNAWIEIYGSNLAPASVGSGLNWSNASSFASGQMPTQLQGVSVTVNGKPAYIYFISPAQVNVLTPLDSTTGPVAVEVNNGTATSAAFTANLQAVAPGFLRFGDGVHIAALHANYSYLGPASMSVPGYTFTPATPSETILLFGDGFGLPVSTLAAGSDVQMGALPTPWPQVTIGGVTAAVQYAGLISPGLYQINVVVPANAANGDNQVIATYGGANSPSGAMIPVSR